MPGIIGIFSENKMPQIDSLLNKMVRPTLHEDWYKVDKYAHPNFAIYRLHFGKFNPEKQPIFNEDKSLCIFMDGKVYGYEREKKLLRQKGHKFIINNDPEFCLHLYEEEGEYFAKRLNGAFLIVIYNFKQKKLLIFNDRYGLLPHYYALVNEKLFFAPEAKAILEVKIMKKEIENKAIADLFAFGELIGNKTFFKNIQTLPPASILKYENDRFSIKQYWDFNYNPDYSKPENEIVDELVNTFKKAVKIRIQDNYNYGILLSGGLDSRSVATAMAKEKKDKITAITFGPADCSEVKIAKQVVQKIGVQLKHLSITPQMMIENAKKTIYLSDGLNFIGASFTPPILEEIRKEIDIIFGGLALDLTLGGSYLDKFSYKFRNKQELSDMLYKRRRLFLDTEVRELFQDRYFKKVKNYPLDSFSDSFNKTQEDNLQNKMDHFFLQNHVRRFTFMGLVLSRYYLDYSTPTYDNNFIDVILTIPPELRVNHHIYRKFLQKFSPELMQIPYDKTLLNPNLPISFWQASIKYHYYLESIKKRIRRISKNKIFLPPKKSYVNFYEWFYKNREWQNYFLNLLLSKNTISTKEYLNREYIRRLFEEHFSGRKDNSMKILRIATFELFLKLFL